MKAAEAAEAAEAGQTAEAAEAAEPNVPTQKTKMTTHRMEAPAEAAVQQASPEKQAKVATLPAPGITDMIQKRKDMTQNPEPVVQADTEYLHHLLQVAEAAAEKKTINIMPEPAEVAEAM